MFKRPPLLPRVPETLIDLLLLRAEAHGEKDAYLWLEDGEDLAETWSYDELLRRSGAVAGRLQELGMAGERALMLYPPGMPFISGFFGCLLAGVVAVPSFPPDPGRLDRTLPRLRAIVNDCKPRVVLTTGLLKEMAREMFPQAPELAHIEWIATDEIDPLYALMWSNPSVAPDRLCFLQYTSGSTGTPKGVMVSHENLLWNSAAIFEGGAFDEHSRFVSWLPSFHDMGLIGGILQPLFGGGTGVQMSPLAFLQKPYRWLSAISRFKGTHSGGPNFSYDLCVARIPPEMREGLDLSSWRLSFSGAEPIRASTIERFAQTYAAYGYRADGFIPAYGLAEGTLLVSGGNLGPRVHILGARADALEKGHIEEATPEQEVRRIVSSGKTWGDIGVAIVDPVSLERLADDLVGEIWVSGKSICAGYWGREQESAETFRAHTRDGSGPWLRTGDLGFMRKGEIFVTGRHKDLIIIRGRNHYPQDIELTVDGAHPACRQGCCAAFSLEGNGTEDLVIVVEVDPKRGEGKLPEIAAAIRKAVAAAHELTVHGLVFIQPRTIDKTSSGKIQRRASRKGFLEGSLSEVGRDFLAAPGQATSAAAAPARPAGRTFDARKHSAMVALLVEKLAARVGQPPERIDIDAPFVSYGLSSQDAVGLSGELEEALGRRLSPTLLYNFPNVAALALHLSGESLAPAALVRPRASQQDAPIAIVGMGMRLPGGVKDPASLWQLLTEGRDAIREVPADRWDVERWFDADPRAVGKMYTRWGGFLDKVDHFDARYFGISPREADAMDPQQRLVLTVATEALDNAGLDVDALNESATGVFIGVSTNDYARGSVFSGDPRRIDAWCGTGNSNSVVAGRISYLMGLRGPAITLDTACSSSLVAVHLAAQSLRSGESDVALAGGVGLILGPEGTVFFSRLGAMSPDGRCHTFDEAANGYVRSEGCGVVVLKRLDDARRDGDHIWAVVRGTAVNQDGRSNGLTAPNGPSQERVIETALAQAGVEPHQVGYLEAHGTGTPLGDPIELSAVGAVLGRGREPGQKLRIGSIKTNIGHTEAAAGVAGLMKAALALHHGVIPPNLHFKTPSKQIPWEDLPIEVPTVAMPWPDELRLAGVSSFGFSGTNAHAVLAAEPASASSGPEIPEGRAALLPLSARDATALSARAASLHALLSAQGAPLLADVLHTSALRRSHHPLRAAVVGRSRQEMLDGLGALAQGQPAPGVVTGRVGVGARKKVVFVFPGQGSQWLGMGRGLLATEPTFRGAIEECERAIRQFCDWSLLEVLESEAEPTRIDVIQPTLWAMEIALAALWRSWGVEPDAVVGHSMGETAAAYVAGALSLSHAAQIICRRSLLLRRVSGQGVMAMVELTVEQAQEALRGFEDKVSIAVSNSPRATVLSGDPAAVDTILAGLEAKGVFCRRIKVDVASHSPQMDPLREELLAALEGVSPREGTLPIYSTVTAEASLGGGFDTTYWTRNLRDPVQFARVVQALIKSGHSLFVEISPHPILAPAIEPMLREALGEGEGLAVASLRRGQDERATMLESLGALYTRGYAVDFKTVTPHGQIAALPAYPWQEERYWYAPLPAGGAAAGGHPLLGTSLSSSVQPGTHLHQRTLSVESLPWLADHKVGETVVFPATAYVEAMISAGRHHFSSNDFELRDLTLREVMAFEPGGSRRVQTVVSAEGPGAAGVRVLSRGEADTEWTTHATGRLVRAADGLSAAPLSEIEATLTGEISAADHYQRLAAVGLAYGPAFRGVVSARTAEGVALGLVKAPADIAGQSSDYALHPAVLDAALQVLSGAIATVHGGGPALPAAMEAVRVLGPAGAECRVVARLVDIEGDRIRGDLTLYGSDGRPFAQVRGLVAQRMATSVTTGGEDDLFLSVSWAQTPALAPTSPARGTWLLLSPGAGALDPWAQALRGAGARVVTLTASSRSAGAGDAWEVDPSQPASLRAALGQIFTSGQGCAGVIYGWGLGSSQPLDAAVLRRAEQIGVAGLLHLTQAIEASRWRDPPRLWVVTRGSQIALPADRIDPSGAMLWGMAGSLSQEQPDLRVVRLDLPITPHEGEVPALLAEWSSDDAEEQVALRGGHRLAARLVRQRPEDVARAARVPAGSQPFRLETPRPGSLEALTLTAMTRRPPGPGEVEVQVAAAGINFIDVMKAFGIYPGLPPGSVPLGGELAGTVIAVGEGVGELAVGQQVFGMAECALGTHVTVDARALVPVPAGLDLAQAAALPSVMATAWYALYDLAHLARGERVLIHSATGGTGLAAIALARRVGAEIFATAGSESKRAWLRAQGITHVYDSRTLDFSSAILTDTRGRGVDVVLNSLSGAAIEASLACMGRDGRFLDLSKKDIYSDRPLSLAFFKKRIAYHAVDLLGYAADHPDRLHALLGRISGAISAGELAPLPVERFPAGQAAEAFRTMAQARHIGKLVVTMDDPQAPIAPRPHAPALSSGGAWLLTGGLGGLGLSVASWLVTQGVRHLVLTGRSGSRTEGQIKAVEALKASGARVDVHALDVSDAAAIKALVQRIRAGGSHLQGVIHAAGVLRDGLLVGQDLASFRQVLAPKVDGAWALHEATRDEGLDYFVLYSSAAAVLGSPGQGNYAAGNAFLDALAGWRRAQGLPAVSINWGAFSEVGLAAAEAGRADRLAGRGMRSLSPGEGNTLLGRVLASGAHQAVVLPLNVRQWIEFYPQAAGSTFLATLVAQAGKAASKAGSSAVKDAALAAPESERPGLIEKFLREQVGAVLRLDPARIDRDAPLKSLGLDSLMGMELRNRMESGLGLTLSATLIWSYPNLAALARHLAQRLAPESAAPTPPAAPEPPPEPAAPPAEALKAEELEELSDDELAALGDDLLS